MITIQYSMSRGEIWRLYWRGWARPSGSWRSHAFIAANVFLLAYMLTRQSPDAVNIAVTAGLVALALAVLLFPLWPQLKFKPEVRTLRIDEQGILSEIRDLQASKSWREIRSISARNDELFIEAADGSALIVPGRAFAAPQQYLEFVSQIKQWHSQHASSNSGFPQS